MYYELVNLWDKIDYDRLGFACPTNGEKLIKIQNGRFVGIDDLKYDIPLKNGRTGSGSKPQWLYDNGEYIVQKHKQNWLKYHRTIINEHDFGAGRKVIETILSVVMSGVLDDVLEPRVYYSWEVDGHHVFDYDEIAKYVPLSLVSGSPKVNLHGNNQTLFPSNIKTRECRIRGIGNPPIHDMERIKAITALSYLGRYSNIIGGKVYIKYVTNQPVTLTIFGEVKHPDPNLPGVYRGDNSPISDGTLTVMEIMTGSMTQRHAVTKLYDVDIDDVNHRARILGNEPAWKYANLFINTKSLRDTYKIELVEWVLSGKPPVRWKTEVATMIRKNSDKCRMKLFQNLVKMVDNV